MISDAHLDLGLDLVRRHRKGEHHNLKEYYVPHWQEAGVGLIVAAVFLSDRDTDEEYYQDAVEQIETLKGELAEVQEAAVLCTSGAELERARAQGKTALILSLEGAEPIGEDLEKLDEFYNKGVRLLGMCWSRENKAGFGGRYDPNGETDVCGLKPFGKELVCRANKLGMLIDVSHLNNAGCADVAALSKLPFFASHSNTRALHPMDRNLSDETIAAIAASGGMVGVNGYSGLVAPTPEEATVAALADHTDYLRKRIGSGRLGLGLDLMIRISGGSDTFTYRGVTMEALDILPDHSHVPTFLKELDRRGYTPEEQAGIAGENWFAFFRDNLK